MALAQGGRFGDAVRVQSALIAADVVATAPATRADRERWAANLARYQAGEPCCAVDDPALLLP